MRLSGAGFAANSKVDIVLDAPKRVVVGYAVAQPDGTFKAAVLVPEQATAGAHKLQVVGTGSSGQPMSMSTRVVVLVQDASVTIPAPSGLARPVLLTVAAVLPLMTWLVLEMLGWRKRHGDRRSVGG